MDRKIKKLAKNTELLFLMDYVIGDKTKGLIKKTESLALSFSGPDAHEKLPSSPRFIVRLRVKVEKVKDDSEEYTRYIYKMNMMNMMKDSVMIYKYIKPMHDFNGSPTHPKQVYFYGVPHICYFAENVGLVFTNPYLGSRVWA